MNNLLNKQWWKAALSRAVKTFCQTAVALLGTDTIGIINVDWMKVISVSGLAAIVSILTSIVGLPEVNGLLDPVALEQDGFADYRDITESEEVQDNGITIQDK